MDPNNIRLDKRNGIDFIKDQYQKDTFFEYEDAYNYYDINVDKIVLFKQSDNEYFIRYNDFNKMEVVPLQLKIKDFYGELKKFRKNGRVMFIHNNDKELFLKNREIWNKIIKLMFINNTPDFAKATLDDDDEFIVVDVLRNTVFTNGIYDDQLVIALHSVINDCLQASVVQIVK